MTTDTSRFARDDHAHRNVPFLTEEDDFPVWPIAVGLAVVSMPIGWGVGWLIGLIP